MSTKMLHFLNALARAFEQNRLLALAQHYSFPTATYIHDGLLVFGSPATLVEALAEYREIAQATGIVKVIPRIVAEGLQLNQRSNLWVEWDHLDENDICQRTSQVRYVLRHTADRHFPQIEIVDYKVPGFPELAENLPLAIPA